MCGHLRESYVDITRHINGLNGSEFLDVFPTKNLKTRALPESVRNCFCFFWGGGFTKKSNQKDYSHKTLQKLQGREAERRLGE